MIEKPIEIDLNQFKLHLKVENKIELSLHFDSPSRRFYLSVMAFVVHEMQKLGRITSIPLEEHHEILALLNETVGGSAGSSKRSTLLPRIYKKWKGALPDLEEAPLFRVLGKKKEYDNGIARSYRFSEEEKDRWANLFDYKGSKEHVRLRLSLDKLGVNLHDAVIVYGEDPELKNGAAWQRFINDLKEKPEDKPKPERVYQPAMKESKEPVLQLFTWKKALQHRWRWLAPTTVMVLVAAVAALLVWKNAFYPPQGEVDSGEEMVLSLPDKPSIAVLPFVNMSGNPEQTYLSDGITEQIITGLAKIPKLFVVARHSTFTYKDKPKKVQQVSRELGVRYVLEGSVHRSDEHIRITAQLIDAFTGHHLWAERYDRKFEDIFAIQDDITKKILEALQVKLTEGEHARLWGKGTNNLDAYLKYIQARMLWRRFVSKETNAQARQIALEAIELDPAYAMAYGMVGYTHWSDLIMNWSESRKDSMEQLEKACQRALALDDSIPMLRSLHSHIYLMKKQFDSALAEGQQAVSMCPNCSENMILLGHILRYIGRPKDAISVLDRAIRLDPFPPVMAYHNLATSYLFAGMLHEALTTYKKALNIEPDNLPANIGLAVTYSSLDKIQEARSIGAVIHRTNPKFSVESFAKNLPYKNQAYNDLLIEGLRKAGLN